MKPTNKEAKILKTALDEYVEARQGSCVREVIHSMLK